MSLKRFHESSRTRASLRVRRAKWESIAARLDRELRASRDECKRAVEAGSQSYSRLRILEDQWKTLASILAFEFKVGPDHWYSKRYTHEAVRYFGECQLVVRNPPGDWAYEVQVRRNGAVLPLGWKV